MSCTGGEGYDAQEHGKRQQQQPAAAAAAEDCTSSKVLSKDNKRQQQQQQQQASAAAGNEIGHTGPLEHTEDRDMPDTSLHENLNTASNAIHTAHCLRKMALNTTIACLVNPLLGFLVEGLKIATCCQLSDFVDHPNVWIKG